MGQVSKPLLKGNSIKPTVGQPYERDRRESGANPLTVRNQDRTPFANADLTKCPAATESNRYDELSGSAMGFDADEANLPMAK